MKTKTQKRGIVLASLLVSIIILSIIAGMVMFVGTDIVKNAKIAAFAKDLTAVYDSSLEYYTVNGDIPVLTDGRSYTAIEYQNAIEGLTNSSYYSSLKTEIEQNLDTDAVFYEIDISKLGIESTEYGVSGEENDFYLISNNSHYIYYFKGFDANGEIYFSSSVITDK